ncbi:MAG TPA: hypothetical protein VF450_19700, partial [Noviherbaspirillum sp.]
AIHMTLGEKVTEGIDGAVISVCADTECAEHGSDGYGDDFVAHDWKLRIGDENVVLRHFTHGHQEPETDQLHRACIKFV